MLKTEMRSENTEAWPKSRIPIRVLRFWDALLSRVTNQMDAIVIQKTEQRWRKPVWGSELRHDERGGGRLRRAALRLNGHGHGRGVRRIPCVDVNGVAFAAESARADRATRPRDHSQLERFIHIKRGQAGADKHNAFAGTYKDAAPCGGWSERDILHRGILDNRKGLREFRGARGMQPVRQRHCDQRNRPGDEHGAREMPDGLRRYQPHDAAAKPLGGIRPLINTAAIALGAWNRAFESPRPGQ